MQDLDRLARAAPGRPPRSRRRTACRCGGPARRRGSRGTWPRARPRARRPRTTAVGSSATSAASASDRRPPAPASAADRSDHHEHDAARIASTITNCHDAIAVSYARYAGARRDRYAGSPPPRYGGRGPPQARRPRRGARASGTGTGHSAIRPPNAMIIAPSQIHVTSGETISRKFDRPRVRDEPRHEPGDRRRRARLKQRVQRLLGLRGGQLRRGS